MFVFHGINYNYVDAEPVKVRKSRRNLIYENKSQFDRNNRHIFNTTRMTTSISSEADWNYKKYVWITENLNGGWKAFYIVAWPTDWRTKYL